MVDDWPKTRSLSMDPPWQSVEHVYGQETNTRSPSKGLKALESFSPIGSRVTYHAWWPWWMNKKLRWLVPTGPTMFLFYVLLWVRNRLSPPHVNFMPLFFVVLDSSFLQSFSQIKHIPPSVSGHFLTSPAVRESIFQNETSPNIYIYSAIKFCCLNAPFLLLLACEGKSWLLLTTLLKVRFNMRVI
jgi:hypothetical protein